MFGNDDSGGVGESDLGPEIFVVDTDVLLGDACSVLADRRKRSELLRALDASTAIAVMSEQTFHEFGWMSAVAARARGVDHDDLRALISDTYLPRIPIVVTPAIDAGHWMPDAYDIADPDDIAHVQVARLISARAVYSHDKHLRRPGVAPSTRPTTTGASSTSGCFPLAVKSSAELHSPAASPVPEQPGLFPGSLRASESNPSASGPGSASLLRSPPTECSRRSSDASASALGSIPLSPRWAPLPSAVTLLDASSALLAW